MYTSIKSAVGGYIIEKDLVRPYVVTTIEEALRVLGEILEEDARKEESDQTAEACEPEAE
jgi:hypothetical protein